MKPIPAKTIKDLEGNILLFSCQQFVEDICQGSSCFICGAAENSKEFNNEHVFPRWLLNRYNLFNKTLTLPNGQQHKYGTYCISCCRDCNSFLGNAVEAPMSELLYGTYSEVIKKLKDYQGLLFTWLCLLFVKVHLKDKLLRANLDYREDQYSIADGSGYYWPELHHIHSVARSSYTNAGLTTGVIGSMLVLPIDDPTASDKFDWVDFTNEKTIVVRIGNIGIIAILNDAGACAAGIRDFILRIRGPIGTTQLRELGTRMAMANADLINRPSFGTIISKTLNQAQIWAEYSDMPEFRVFDYRKYGERLAHALSDRLEYLSVNGESGSERIKSILLTGKASFLLDSKGEFSSRIEWVANDEA